MKNWFVLILVLIAFVSCKKTETNVKEDIQKDSLIVEKTDSTTIEKLWVSKNQDFLDKFRLIELDTVRFVSPRYDEKQIGPSLTKEELKLFPNDERFDSFIGGIEKFQAFLKFEINNNLYGLIVRMPGEYDFTAMHLYFYDKTKDEILPKSFEVADTTGDAGYSEETKSWLFKDGNQLKSFTYHWTKVEKIEPEDPTRESRTDDYYLIKLSPEKIDTTRVSKTDLIKFQKLLKQK